MKRRNLFARAMLSFAVFLASCATAPTTPTAITPTIPMAEQVLVNGIWSLATQNRPVELADVMRALNLKFDDYDDSTASWDKRAGWDHRLSLKMGKRDKPGTDLIVAVNLSMVEPYNPHLPASRKPAKPLTQTIEVVLRPPSCMNGETVGKQLGVDVKKEFHPGFADVLPATFNVISSETDHAAGKVMIGVGCLNVAMINLAFTE